MEDKKILKIIVFFIDTITNNEKNVSCIDYLKSFSQRMPNNNEAHARIKINKLLEEAGWKFFDDEAGTANILLENQVKITQQEVDAWGNDYENIKSGSLDFLLLDSNNKPICVLEAKKESLHPLVAKEQARKYANTVSAQFIILSNGIVHYLWDLKKLLRIDYLAKNTAYSPSDLFCNQCL